MKGSGKPSKHMLLEENRSLCSTVSLTLGHSNSLCPSWEHPGRAGPPVPIFWERQGKLSKTGLPLSLRLPSIPTVQPPLCGICLTGKEPSVHLCPVKVVWRWTVYVPQKFLIPYNTPPSHCTIHKLGTHGQLQHKIPPQHPRHHTTLCTHPPGEL